MKRISVWGWMCVVSLVCALGVGAQQREGRGELPEKVRLPVAAEPEAPTKSVPVTMGARDVPMVGVPRLVKVSGVVRDRLGEPSTGVVGITFALYGEQEGGAALWLETQNVELDAQGRYTALLGAEQVEGFPLEVLATDEPRWLGVWVQGEPEEQPRILLVSVPYALKAAEAETLAGKSASEFLLVEELQTPEGRKKFGLGTIREGEPFPRIGDITAVNAGTGLKGGGTSGDVTLELDTAFADDRYAQLNADNSFTGSNTFTTGSFSGSTGDPLMSTAILRVTQNGTPPAGSLNVAVQGESTASTGVTIGVEGITASPGGRGVRGRALGSGVTRGVEGIASSPDGIGVAGSATASCCTNFGVQGITQSIVGRAVQGRADATGGHTIGVEGLVFSSSGTGVRARATANTGPTVGVWATVQSLMGTAGVFDNSAGGNILVGRGSGDQVFRVDGSGNVTTSGVFTGDGSGLTNITATATVTDADTLDGLDSTAFAQVAAANTFSGTQTAPDLVGTNSVSTVNLNLSGSINQGFVVQANATSPNLIGGFSGNSVTSGVVGATIGGGGDSASTFTNRVTDNFGTVGGGSGNQAGDDATPPSDEASATVGGGFRNTASGPNATVGGGFQNTASGSEGTIGGGFNNTASGFAPTIGGGESNTTSGFQPTVGGGEGNTASGGHATVGGGQQNTASDFASTVGGGFNNTASRVGATVPGGHSNTAQGSISFAAGTRAQALHDGAFVWGDFTNADVTSTADNQFLARASGGVTFFTDTGLTTGVTVGAGGGSWSSVSDRNLKENFAPVEGQSLLARLNEIPIETWNYKTQDDSIRHLGPMAQDFRAAFELGSDDKHISTVDADGVALAAIQELYRMVLQKDEQLQKMQAQMLELQAELALVKAQFTRSDKAQIAALELQE